MKQSLTLILTSLICITLSGQTDPEAVKVLDRFSAKALSAPSVSMKFKVININATEGTRDTLEGSLIMSKDQYRLELPDNIIWFNGSATWNYLIAEKEVTITRPDRKDDSFMNRPSSLFTLYKKGYKIRLLEDNVNSYIIDLYPEDLNSDLIRIRLTIGKSLLDLINAEYKRKDGISIIISVKEYNLKTIPDPSAFTFNPKNYKGVEIIDMR